jgi:hypothetical protein
MATTAKDLRSGSLSLVKATILTLRCPACNAAIMVGSSYDELYAWANKVISTAP